MSPDKIVIVSIYGITGIAHHLAMFLIRHYHEKKPLGMQTVLTRVTVYFTKVSAASISIFICNICILEIYGPFSWTMSCLLTLLDYLSAILFYSSLASSLCIKYCLIYHSHLLESFSDTTLMKCLKATIAIIVLIAPVIEYGFVTSFDNSGAFQIKHLGYSKTNSSLEVGLLIAAAFSLLSIVILQARIEFDAYNTNDIQTGKFAKFVNWIKQTDFNNFGYSLKVLRTVVISGVSLGLYLICQISGGLHNLRWNQMTFLCVLFGVLPYIFILKHEGMSNILTNQLLTTCFPNL